MKRSYLRKDPSIEALFAAEEPPPEAVRQRIDETLAALPEAPVGQRRIRRRKARLDRMAVGVVSAALLVAVAWFVLQPDAVQATKPMLHSIFRWIGDQGLMDRGTAPRATDMQALPIAAEASDQGYVLRIHEVSFDGLRLSVSYSIRGPKGETGTHVTPDFRWDEALPEGAAALLASDSGIVLDDGEAGIANAFVAGRTPERFTGMLRVERLMLESVEGGVSIEGNWSVEFEVVRQGGPVADRLPNGPIAMRTDDARLQLLSIRSSDTATEWRLKLVQSYAKVSANQYDSSFRRSLDFRFSGPDGQSLAVLTKTKHGRVVDKTAPREEWQYEEELLAYTEPIGSGRGGAAVTTIERVHDLEKNEVSERELSSLSQWIPLK
ncbi:DUF4179 domain-containing protein [Paenibacillus sp. TRM 82003]|nr:DUF4179 domain-containing protein [Paenibacillus sp. TRM 82003]